MRFIRSSKFIHSTSGSTFILMSQNVYDEKKSVVFFHSPQVAYYDFYIRAYFSTNNIELIASPHPFNFHNTCPLKSDHFSTF